MSKLIPFPLLPEEDIKAIKAIECAKRLALLKEEDIKAIECARHHLQQIVLWYLDVINTFPKLGEKSYTIPLGQIFDAEKSLEKIVDRFTKLNCNSLQN